MREVTELFKSHHALTRKQHHHTMSSQPYMYVHALATMHMEPAAAVCNLSNFCLLLCQYFVIMEPGTNSLYSAT